MTIIIKVPQPDTEWRLVLVTRNTVIHATYGRDATPADLERAGYVLRGGRQDLDCAISDLTAQVREAEDRAEKAEAHIKSLHDAEQATRRILDAVICEPTADAAARVHHNWVATRERAETAEADATLAQQQRATMYERAETAERERDEAYRDRDAAMRERDEARAELARLTAPAEGEPSGAGLRERHGRAWRCLGVDAAFVAVWRDGVAHERARHAQPEKDRATDEELYGLFNSTTMAFPVRAGVLAVAARVRQERCLVARVVSASMSMHVYRRGHDGWAVALGPRFVECERADVPATLARLLGEVSR